ncbi:MAG: metallophosphoesterase [Elusimicrobia bacterium]|nr:metallophosphoesterase [Elusimicrobiota bacterium]
MSELVAAQAFLAAVAAVFYIEARLLLHAWLHRREKPRPRFWTSLSEAASRRLCLFFHAAAALGAGCVLYGFLLEPSWIEVKTVRLSSPKIARASGTIRIVQISDFHSEAKPRNEPRAAGIVDSLKPDIIAVTGDYLNTPEGLPAARRLLSSLHAPYGVFCVRGNYDLMVPAPGLFDGLPLQHLDRRAALTDVRGTKVRVLGLDLESSPYFKRLMASSGPSPGYDILLHHFSDLVYEADEAGIDLYLSGHTHGGQIRLPLYGALVTLATFGKRFENGLYQVGRTALYVNRGLGMEGGLAPRARFLCRPEITVFEISTAENP